MRQHSPGLGRIGGAGAHYGPFEQPFDVEHRQSALGGREQQSGRGTVGGDHRLQPRCEGRRAPGPTLAVNLQETRGVGRIRSEVVMSRPTISPAHSPNPLDLAKVVQPPDRMEVAHPSMPG